MVQRGSNAALLFSSKEKSVFYLEGIRKDDILQDRDMYFYDPKTSSLGPFSPCAAFTVFFSEKKLWICGKVKPFNAVYAHMG